MPDREPQELDAPASPIGTHPVYPGWSYHPCTSCRGSGLYMPGDVLLDCPICHGWVGWWKHDATGTLAAYPGGMLLGRDPVTSPIGAAGAERSVTDGEVPNDV